MEYLGFDGDNTVSTGRDSLTSAWTFVHGPGRVDDPILGFHNEAGSEKYWYYVTDGEGRQFAVGDATGYDRSTDLMYFQNGGKFAGGSQNANSFGIQRAGNAEMYNLVVFRNRFYDQASGRWTQEDPIGVAAGTNLYAYAGNNPVMFTDPFGLCFPWPQCALAGAAVGARVGTVIGAGVGTVVGTPGVGTLAGAGIGRTVGAIGTFVVLTGSAIAMAVAASADGPDDRTADEIISDDKKGSIRREFPGEMLGKTLDEIARIARDRRSPDQDAAKKAKKLLKDKRFDKES